MGSIPTISIGVRDLVEFTCRTGNLGGSSRFSSAQRAVEGTRGHQVVQKARPAGYEREVRVSRMFQYPAFVLEVHGRIDGMMRGEDTPWVEEIKTIAGTWDGVPDPLHWSQGKAYAALMAEEFSKDRIEVRLTYLELDSGHVTTFREIFAATELQRFLSDALAIQAEWLADHQAWRAVRDASLQATVFPHREYRAGQRDLAVAVYRTLRRGGTLFAEAPTGTGKTISVLFPALKALGEGMADQILFATAKTSGRAAAEKALSDLRASGARIRSLTLTARDKICFGEQTPCDTASCPFAIGYHDRVLTALRELLARESIGRTQVEDVARIHSVCPFALSIAAIRWCDVVIGDFNHAFDPGVRLTPGIEGVPQRCILLVDEAHNLVERARAIFSGSLLGKTVAAVQKEVRVGAPVCSRALSALARVASAVTQRGDRHQEPPAELMDGLRTALSRAEQALARNQPFSGREELLAWYFDARYFEAVVSEMSEASALTSETDRKGATDWRIDLRCLDPSERLRGMLKEYLAVVFFSATLSPLPYHRRLLGGAPEDATLQLPSPFPPDNLGVLIDTSVATDFKGREESLAAVADRLRAFIQARPGNYLVFFPSYRYLERVAEHLQTEATTSWRLLMQRSGMSEAEREEFLRSFHEPSDTTLVGLAVMGGVFGEGIDLVGERLIGVAVVGVGLPQIGAERDLIRERFDKLGENGFDHAYRFPGLNRLVQAAGRLIRSEQDRGMALLLDARWKEPAYARLLPPHWWMSNVHTPEQIHQAAVAFWSRAEDALQPRFNRSGQVWAAPAGTRGPSGTRAASAAREAWAGG